MHLDGCTSSVMRQAVRSNLTTVLLLIIIVVLAAHSWFLTFRDHKSIFLVTLPPGTESDPLKDLQHALQDIQATINEQDKHMQSISKLEQKIRQQGSLLQSLAQQAQAKDAGTAGSSSTGAADDKCAQAKALQAARNALKEYTNSTGIPKIIHQMYGLYGDDPPEYMGRSVDSFKLHNPHHIHILWNAQDVHCFLEQYYPAIYPIFMRLKLPVLKADIARYLVVLTFGGVYSDVDTMSLRPVDEWADGKQGICAIVGVEADGSLAEHWEKSWGRKLQICQWTFAATPQHPVLANCIYRILKLLIAAGPENIINPAVTHTTGPSVFSDSVYDYMATQGHKWDEYLGMDTAQVIGDLYLLTITGFSPGVGHMKSKWIYAPEAKVQHMFKGSWTKQGTK